MIGEPVDVTPGVLPSLWIEGRYTIIEALSVEKHAEDLLAVYGQNHLEDVDLSLFNHDEENLENWICSFEADGERKDPSIVRLS